jgi:hypothetical protein
MAVQNEVILLLEENIKQILLVAEGLKINNKRLKQQVAEMSEAIRMKDSELNELKSKYHHLRLAKGLAGQPDEANEAKRQINRMVREIDKCIALLNR